VKLLFVHERFGALAGAEANAFLTARELKCRGHRVAILHGATTGKAEAAWEETFSERFVLGEKGNASRTQTALAQFQPDIVYVHKMADLEVIETLVAARVPLVRMVHDHDIYCMRSYKYNYFNRKICTRAATPFCVFPCGAFLARNHNDGFPLKFVSYGKKKKEIALNKKFQRMIVVSHYMREELLRNGFDPLKIEIMPPVPPLGERELRSNFSERNLILFAGQIIRGKGVDLLLQSLALIKTPFECIILGDGTHRSFCEALSRKLNLHERVHFAGFIPQEQLKDFYRECSVMAISSVWPEPFATIGMEVMRYGIPVVAFDVGGISDWLLDEYNGFLVPWMDKNKFASRLEELLKNKSLAREMGKRGGKLVETQFSFSSYIQNLEAMFAKVLNGN